MGVSQVTADCSNSFTLWLVHTITKSGLARLVFEEWFLHHHTPQRLSVLDIKKLRGAEITSAEYKHQVLAIGLSTGAVRLYQPASDIQRLRRLVCRSEILTHTGPVCRLAISERLVVSCGEDCTLTVTSLLNDGSLLVSHRLHGHVSRVRCVSLDGSLLLSGSDDRSAKVWWVDSGESSESCGALRTLSGHAWPVCAVWLAGGLAVTADTSTVRIWDSQAGGLLRIISGLTNTQEVRLDLSAGSLLISSSLSNISSYSLTSHTQPDSASWQFKPHHLTASTARQVRLTAGHSSLVLLTTTANSHNLNIIDFLS